MIRELHVTLEHFDDWTVVTEELDRISIRSLAFSSNPPDYNIEVLLVNGERDQVSQFASMLRKGGLNSIRKVLYVSKIRGRGLEVGLLGDFAQSIRRRLMERGMIFSSLEIRGGLESYKLYSVTCGRECLADLRAELTSCSKVHEFSTFVHTPPLSPEAGLTPLEERVLRVAYEEGLFDTPRGVKLEDLARSFKVSKNTLNYHVKNGIKKILRRYFASWINTV